MTSNNDNNCGVCNEKLPKNGDHAICGICNAGLHLDKVCSGLKRTSWKAMGPSTKSSWSCLSCRKARKASASQTDEETELGNSEDSELEVGSLAVQKSILAKVNSLLELKSKIENIETSVSFMAENYDVLIKELAEVRAENGKLRTELAAVKAQSNATKDLADTLACQVAELDQYGRRVNMEIHGLTPDTDLSKENIAQVLQNVAKDIGVEYRHGEIHQAHRLQQRNDGKPPAIIVQFYSKQSRDDWIEKRRRAKLTKKNNKVYFNENMCPQYRLLLKEAKLRASTYNYSFVWFRGGRILMKKDQDSNNVLVIRCKNDLNKIK